MFIELLNCRVIALKMTTAALSSDSLMNKDNILADSTGRPLDHRLSHHSRGQFY